MDCRREDISRGMAGSVSSATREALEEGELEFHCKFVGCFHAIPKPITLHVQILRTVLLPLSDHRDRQRPQVVVQPRPRHGSCNYDSQCHHLPCASCAHSRFHDERLPDLDILNIFELFTLLHPCFYLRAAGTRFFTVDRMDGDSRLCLSSSTSSSVGNFSRHIHDACRTEP